ncbi:hypothetical protein [Alteromonas sp. BMJM2]|uniref:hypothetical protein n=1 Tax=Alteromonas sp. BMJM2 TaxID=2954241 RepID=UPI0022B3069F|nr:hypothetical protein [Alteromonas sp. BMJM2]
MARSIAVLPETEHQYLTITGKISVVLAVFLFGQLCSEIVTGTDLVVNLILDLTIFVSVIYCIVLSVKSMKFAKHITRMGYWTLKFNDEYVDHVSSASLRATCHIMVVGAIFLAYSGDNRWFVELIAPFGLRDAIQMLLGLAVATHGALILWNLREEEHREEDNFDEELGNKKRGEEVIDE